MSNKNLGKKRDRGYRIVRLVNGERLIAKISGSNSNKLFLDRPMSIRGVISPPNEMSGMSKEFLVLNNWNEFCSNNVVGIPRQFILTISDPDTFIEDAYETQKSHEDTYDATSSQSGLNDDLMDKIKEEIGESQVEDIIQDIIGSIISNFDGSDIGYEWKESDLDKDREDFGNELDDWSPYPEDYFDEGEPPSQI
tara:strand:- start:2850 stop:3434 length:585 start_codon:yes stop_codon:yes gene_type:complete